MGTPTTQRRVAHAGLFELVADLAPDQFRIDGLMG